PFLASLRHVTPSSLCLAVLFVPSLANPRLLPSFPTRRSSDLGVDARGGSALAVQAVVEGRDHLVLALDPGVDVLQGPSARTRWSDRKSTRLNSSHVSISYAVFCLKKKKHI